MTYTLPLPQMPVQAEAQLHAATAAIGNESAGEEKSFAVSHYFSARRIIRERSP